MQRKKLLMQLLNYQNNPLLLQQKLSEYPWDSKEDLVVLTNKQIQSVLNLYCSNILSNQDVEDWANVIECREDIGYENDNVKNIIYELANPLLTQPLSIYRAQQLNKTISS